MTQDERMKANQRLHKKANEMRGLFLNRVSVIEQLISEILTDVGLNQSKKGDAKRVPLTKNKRILFEQIEKRVPDYYLLECKKHLSPLDDIIKLRNCLAHSLIDVSENAHARPLSEGIGFLDWNEGNPITDEQFNDYVVKTTMAYSSLGDIRVFFPRSKNRGS